MQSELKPCAHCGGEAECDSRQAFRAMSSGKIRGRFAIYCTSCNSDMGFCYDDIESSNHDAAVDQTIIAWNARASDTEITRLTEAMRAAEEREKGLREGLNLAANRMDVMALAVSHENNARRYEWHEWAVAARQALAGAKP